jgi:hypothetical protein
MAVFFDGSSQQRRIVGDDGVTEIQVAGSA